MLRPWPCWALTASQQPARLTLLTFCSEPVWLWLFVCGHLQWEKLCLPSLYWTAASVTWSLESHLGFPEWEPLFVPFCTWAWITGLCGCDQFLLSSIRGHFMNIFNAERSKDSFVSTVLLVLCGVLTAERTKTPDGKGGRRATNQGLGQVLAAAHWWSWPAFTAWLNPHRKNLENRCESIARCFWHSEVHFQQDRKGVHYLLVLCLLPWCLLYTCHLAPFLWAGYITRLSAVRSAWTAKQQRGVHQDCLLNTFP